MSGTKSAKVVPMTFSTEAYSSFELYEAGEQINHCPYDVDAFGDALLTGLSS